MERVRLLVVEDNEQDRGTCRDTLKRYIHETNKTIDIVECATLKEALSTLDNSFDGAIVDLRLDKQGNEGNSVVQEIVSKHYRIPIAILTGTPADAMDNVEYIGVFKKGEIKYTELFDMFWDIHNTGLTQIMGGRGIIEQTLSKVFQYNILPQRSKWMAYGRDDSMRTQKALLRHTLSHLIQILDEDDSKYFPEEVYIFPTLVDSIKTGSIVKHKETGSHCVVMNPACDMVIRTNGCFKTDTLLLAEIDQGDLVNQTKGVISSKNKKQKKKIEGCQHHNVDSECFKHLLEYQEALIRTKA
jgi:CheY-like chemotaxis protein